MFYCQECAIKHAWPYSVAIHRSRCRCDSCGQVEECLDVPSQYLTGAQQNPDRRWPIKPKEKVK